MDIKQITSPELTRYLAADNLNKKKILEEISTLVHQSNSEIKYLDILEALQQRERIGHTAIGHGVAIPHARLEGLSRPTCAIINLAHPINFAGQDSMLVDLIFGLVVPNHEFANEHVKLLGILADKLNNKSYRDQLRRAQTDNDLYNAVICEA